PDGPVADKPYAVLHKVMTQEDRYAVATMVFSGHEQVVVVRPLGKLLAVTLLNYEETVKKPDTFVSEVPDMEVSAKELELAQSLVRAATIKKLDFAKYRDAYTERVTKLIAAKAKGKRLVRASKRDEPVILNLMDALRKSL